MSGKWVRLVNWNLFFFFFAWSKKKQKNQAWKFKNLKTTSKLRSTARAVRLSGSTRGLLPLRFFVVFLRFLFKGGERSDEQGSFVFIKVFVSFALMQKKQKIKRKN